ncbi:lachesin-like [Liolophura sinensis]|uniref:lachesin-like n=1 Tax=Liolophura sinensis TaxID=3198878 RepID=UPI00315978C4
MGTGKEKTVNVTVYYPPVVSVVLVSGDNVTEGNPLQLECRTVSVPQNSTYSAWNRTIGGLPVPLVNNSPGKFLSISQVTFRDQGVYQCEASNGFGDVQRGQLEVKVRARPQFFTQNNSQVASIVENVKLMFKFVSYPSYKNLIWFKLINGTPERLFTPDTIGSKYRRHVSTIKHEFAFDTSKVLLPGYVAELEISNVNRHDFGLYTLKVENEVGFSNFNISLILKGEIKEKSFAMKH